MQDATGNARALAVYLVAGRCHPCTEADIRRTITSIRPVFASLLIRTLVLWVLARALFTVTGAFARSALNDLSGPDPAGRGFSSLISLTPPVALLVAAAVVVLVLSDVRAVRERTFFANIGVSLRMIAGMAFGVALVCEAVVAAVLA